MTSNGPTSGISSDWESLLTQAFEVLLGRPLSAYDLNASYGAYYGGNWLYETELHKDTAWLNPAALAGQQTITRAEELILLDGYPELRFDASQSLFEIDLSSAELTIAFKQDLAEAVLPAMTGIIRGADLAPLLARHAIDLAAPHLPEETWCLWQARIASNGTLLDALRVATGIGHDPDSLIPFTSPPISVDREAEREADATIAAVWDAGLRAHLRTFCNRSSDDLAFCPTDTQESGESEGASTVAMWEGAVDQYEITVRNLDIFSGKSWAQG